MRFVTNFQPEKKQNYEQAIERYKFVAPNVLLVIGAGTHGHENALYLDPNLEDISKFWEIYRSL